MVTNKDLRVKYLFDILSQNTGICGDDALKPLKYYSVFLYPIVFRCVESVYLTPTCSEGEEEALVRVFL